MLKRKENIIISQISNGNMSLHDIALGLKLLATHNIHQAFGCPTWNFLNKNERDLMEGNNKTRGSPDVKS